jgi:hypothetical protein
LRERFDPSAGIADGHDAAPQPGFDFLNDRNPRRGFLAQQDHDRLTPEEFGHPVALEAEGGECSPLSVGCSVESIGF